VVIEGGSCHRRGMDRHEVEEDLPVLLFYYDEVVKILETKGIHTRRIVPRREA
jgi:hypothetical protein